MAEFDWRRLPALTTLRAFEATARMQGVFRCGQNAQRNACCSRTAGPQA